MKPYIGVHEWICETTSEPRISFICTKYLSTNYLHKLTPSCLFTNDGELRTIEYEHKHRNYGVLLQLRLERLCL